MSHKKRTRINIHSLLVIGIIESIDKLVDTASFNETSENISRFYNAFNKLQEVVVKKINKSAETDFGSL